MFVHMCLVACKEKMHKCEKVSCSPGQHPPAVGRPGFDFLCQAL